MKPSNLEKIKEVGYWRFNYQPFEADNLSLQECKELIVANNVQIRGWDFPHVARGAAGDCVKFYDSYVQEECDWNHHVEFWRMYQSSQFISYRAMWEDLIDPQMRPRGKLVLGTGSAIYTITEAVEFLFRLGQVGLYKKGIVLSVSVHTRPNRILWVDSPNRIPFGQDRVHASSEINLVQKIMGEEIKSNPINLAATLIANLFDKFGWNPERSKVTADVELAYKGRIG